MSNPGSPTKGFRPLKLVLEHRPLCRHDILVDFAGSVGAGDDRRIVLQLDNAG
jgi:hypothetical protein